MATAIPVPFVARATALTPLSASSIMNCWPKRSAQVYPVTDNSGKARRDTESLLAFCIIEIISFMLNSMSATFTLGEAAATRMNPKFSIS